MLPHRRKRFQVAFLHFVVKSAAVSPRITGVPDTLTRCALKDVRKATILGSIAYFFSL